GGREALAGEEPSVVGLEREVREGPADVEAHPERHGLLLPELPQPVQSTPIQRWRWLAARRGRGRRRPRVGDRQAAGPWSGPGLVFALAVAGPLAWRRRTRRAGAPPTGADQATPR